MIFADVTPFWNENTIICLSLSKFGLPGARCGIVIANPKIVKAMSNLSGIMALSPGSIGPEIALPLVKSRDILKLSDQVIKPFYQNKSQRAIQLLQDKIKSPNFRIHEAEGALFLWLWFKDLPISSDSLYKILKKKGVIVVSGHYFFPGLSQQWPHTNECIRLNYAQSETVLVRAIDIIADTINALYETGSV